MYLSRVLYGASTACKVLKTDSFALLADISFKQLKEFNNPKGGYYWAKDASNIPIHDSENVNMAQAFVLYGLVAYADLRPSFDVDKMIEKQTDFIINNLYDSKNGGFIDGFDENWILGLTPSKAFGTHLHILESFVKVYEYNKSEKIVPLIEELITLILEHFITKDTFDCLHRLTPDWKVKPNEIWAGHNAECSWILCNAAKAINNENLILKCNTLSLNIMQQVIEKAFDTKNGGVFNVLKNDLPTENFKIWWPQAEVVLALLNCYSISKEDKYKERAVELMNYISNNFIAENGEWYTEIYDNGKPNLSIPIIHFWKSLYHTVRYYALIIENN
jgi:mannobiose 2-epimerase